MSPKFAAGLRRRALALAAAAVLALSALLPAAAEPASTAEILPNRVRVPVLASGVDEGTRLAAPPTARGVQSATFVVTYDAGFQASPTARAVFQAALNIWAAQITSSVPITVVASYANLGPGVLGSAGFGYGARNFTGALRANTYYPAPVAAKLAGRDLSPGTPMIEAEFSSTAAWYYGTDGNTPSGKIDFESVVLHELGHGLGFAGSGYTNGANGVIASPPLVYDVSVVDGAGLSILDVANNSAAMGVLFRGNNLFWGGATGVANNAGARPKLYAPSTWQDGSSFSHLDETTYPPGTANSLMTPRIGTAESIHDPGPIVRGMLADMGWTAGATTYTLPPAGAYRTFLPVGSRSAGT